MFTKFQAPNSENSEPQIMLFQAPAIPHPNKTPSKAKSWMKDLGGSQHLQEVTECDDLCLPYTLTTPRIVKSVYSWFHKSTQGIIVTQEWLKSETGRPTRFDLKIDCKVTLDPMFESFVCQVCVTLSQSVGWDPRSHIWATFGQRFCHFTSVYILAQLRARSLRNARNQRNLFIIHHHFTSSKGHWWSFRTSGHLLVDSRANEHARQ